MTACLIRLYEEVACSSTSPKALHMLQTNTRLLTLFTCPLDNLGQNPPAAHVRRSIFLGGRAPMGKWQRNSGFSGWDVEVSIVGSGTPAALAWPISGWDLMHVCVMRERRLVDKTEGGDRTSNETFVDQEFHDWEVQTAPITLLKFTLRSKEVIFESEWLSFGKGFHRVHRQLTLG